MGNLTLEEMKQVYNQIVKDKEKLKGLNALTFEVFAEGEGIVNFNGGESGTGFSVDTQNKNITYPKLNGVPIVGFGMSGLKNATIFMSSECFKHEMFLPESANYHFSDNLISKLVSAYGILNGFMVTQGKNKSSKTRKAAVTLTNFSTNLITKTQALLEIESKIKEILEKERTEELGKELKQLKNQKEQLIKQELEKYSRIFKVELNESFLDNGKVYLETKTKDGDTEKTDKDAQATTFYKKFKTINEKVYYKSTGFIDIKQLQFIPTGNELQRDSLGLSKEKEILEVKELLELYLNNLKNEVIKYEFKTNTNIFNKIKDFIKNKEVVVEYGSFEVVGSIENAINKLKETGLKLNDVSIWTLILKYFLQMENTKITRNKYFAKTKNIFVDFEINQDLLENIDFLKIPDFYQKVID